MTKRSFFIKIITLCLFLIFIRHKQVFSNSIDTVRHKISIGLPFVSNLWRQEKFFLNISFKSKIVKDYLFRSGYSYSLDNTYNLNENILNVGVEKNLVKSKNVSFYGGIDVGFSYKSKHNVIVHDTIVKNINETTYSCGIGIVLGIDYRINKNFSIESELSAFHGPSFRIFEQTINEVMIKANEKKLISYPLRIFSLSIVYEF